MRFVGSIVLAALTALSFGTETYADTRLPTHVGGRVVVESDGAYLFQWPGVYFEARFSGRAVSMKFNDEVNSYRLYIDGQSRADILKPGTQSIKVADLAAGPHTIRLEKFTETQKTQGRFLGFYVQKRKEALPVPQRSLQFEFIGDSYTVGYGNTSTKTDCDNNYVKSHTNTSEAFGPIVAKAFDADYQINASSGFGVVRNYDNKEPGTTLPVLYQQTLFSRGLEYKDANWNPSVLVVGLGTNDFSTPVKAGEAWKDEAALSADFGKGYTTFLASLRKAQPHALIVVMASEKLEGRIYLAARGIVDGLEAAGDKHIGFVPIVGISYGGCSAHPDVDDSVLIAKHLISYIQSHSDFKPIAPAK